MQLSNDRIGEMFVSVQNVARRAGQRLRETWQGSKTHAMKDERDLVTTVDTEIEELLKRELTRQFPEVGFWGEETGRVGEQSAYQWLVDPIDGTKYFAAEIPLFTVSIGLMRGDEPVLGVIYQPISDQLYAGAQGIPAAVNGTPIHVSDRTELRKAMVSVDFVKVHDANPAHQQWATQRLGELTLAAYRVRMLGSGSLSLCYIATGAFDGYLDFIGTVKPQDIAAGLAIVAAAGGQLSKVHSAHTSHWVVSNSHLHNALTQVITA